MAAGFHHDKNGVATESGSILPNVCRLMQNDMLITKIRLKLKLEIEFQYGGRPFSETGSRFISDGAWDISPKRGMQIDFHLLKWVQSPNINPEVDFQLYDRHLE